jgi:hypothetical protein
MKRRKESNRGRENELREDEKNQDAIMAVF